MTEQEIAAKRGRVFALVGAGIAGFVGAYTFATDKVTSSATSLVLVVGGLLCFMIAGKIAKNITKEIASK